MRFTELTCGTLKKASACFLCLALLTITACQPAIFTSSDSPDGKYRCEVTRSRPLLSGVFGDGEFRYYHFYLVEVSTHQRLPGQGFEYGDGKIQLDKDKIEFKWAGDELTVIDNAVSPAQPFAVADFHGKQQYWQRVN